MCLLGVTISIIDTSDLKNHCKLCLVLQIIGLLQMTLSIN